MPTYDYRCNACSHEFELFQSMKDKPKKVCPACGKSALERLIGTGAAIVFKGSGFYQTDYRSESYRKAAEAEAKPATPAASEKDGAKAEAPKDAAAKPVETKAETPKVVESGKAATAGAAKSAGKKGSSRATGGKAK